MPAMVSSPDASTHETTEVLQTTASPFEPKSWVPLVRRITPRTRFVTLPAALVRSLTTGTVRMRGPTHTGYDDDDDPDAHTWSDGTPVTDDTPAGDTRADDDDECADEARVTRAINEAIAELRGAVCPKAVTACPFDAAWVTATHSTRCENGEEVLTLLQASERATRALQDGCAAALALRQWADLDARMELRAFVRTGTLVALCARRETQAPRDVASARAEADAVAEWIATSVHPRVLDLFGDDYVVDVYVDRAGAHWVLDFAKWGAPTDALLFDWDELANVQGSLEDGCLFRTAEAGQAIRPANAMYHGIPLELRNPEAGAALAEAARQMEQQQRGDEATGEGAVGGDRNT